LRFKKYIPHANAGKTTLLFLLLFFPALVHAQNDTTILADSLQPAIIDVPIEDSPPVVESTEQTEDDYFLRKWGITENNSIIQRHVPDSIIKKMQGDDDFWYANAEIKQKMPDEKESKHVPLGQQQWFQIILWLVIIVGFGAAIISYLSGSDVGLFRRKNKPLQTSGDDEVGSEDIFAINYQKDINKAEANGNFRLAIRLMFLRLLKDMAERNIIQYKQDKTNLDYLIQLHPTGYYDNFFRITRNYEYSWYGKFDVGEDAYRIIRNDFSQFDHQLK
jgi:hypothetical protein